MCFTQHAVLYNSLRSGISPLTLKFNPTRTHSFEDGESIQLGESLLACRSEAMLLHEHTSNRLTASEHVKDLCVFSLKS